MCIENLTDTDYRILKFFKNNSPASIEDVSKHLPDIEAIEYRIKILATSEYKQLHNISLPIDNTKCLKEDYEEYTENGFIAYRYLGTFNITILGKKALQDYEIAEKQRKKDMWLQNAKIPILVTIITNLIIDGTKWLLPLILQLLSNFPK